MLQTQIGTSFRPPAISRADIQIVERFLTSAPDARNGARARTRETCRMFPATDLDDPAGQVFAMNLPASDRGVRDKSRAKNAQTRGFAMLIVSRKQNEQVLIGDDIRVRVLRIRGNRVQLGLETAGGLPDRPRRAAGNGPVRKWDRGPPKYGGKIPAGN